MTDTVRVPKAFSDWLYGVEGYGLRVERLSEELRDPVDKLLPWLLAAFEVGLAASPQGQGSSADDIGHELIAFANQIEGASHDARAAAVQFFSERIARRVTEGVKPQPDALPGDLREKIEVVEEWLSLVDTFTAQNFSRVRHVPICQGEIDALVAILSLIQSKHT